MTESERDKILVEWNQTQRNYSLEKGLHQLVEEQVARTPEAVAVIFEGTSLTYAQLNQRANRLAHYLLELGIQKGSLVAVCLERSLEMVVALLGTVKAGAAYVPIDPGYPADRVAFMVGDANAPVVLTQETLRGKLPPSAAKIVCLDSDWEVVARESAAAPEVVVAGEDLAYVIYTSGSTGAPKGAMNTHRGICNRLLWMQEAYSLNTADCILQKTPFSFDISVWEFFWPLLAGARLVMALPGGHRDNHYLLETIVREQITVLHFVPSMLRHFLQASGLGRCTSLRRVICSGEALPKDLQETFFERLPGVKLHNLYGPTEAAVDVTYWDCRPHDGLRFVPIGRPIANTQVYILDENRQPVPVGAIGELYLGGVGIARGYHNRPELTLEKFVPDPFGYQSGGHLFRTADLGRYLPDGSIEFLGRRDQQVKIRGFRIELGEIESVLCLHPAVQASAVVARPDFTGAQSLTAFVVLPAASTLTVAALNEWLREKLPDYMIPARFVAIPDLPLTPNGKLDRQALLKLEGKELAAGDDCVAPRNERERILVEIWQQVLQRDQVGVEDNFFVMGGHSLLAAVMCARVNRQLAVDVTLSSVFAHPTIEKLARHLESLTGHPAAAKIEKAGRHQSLPVSFGQQQMWLVQQTLSDPATYNEPVACRITGRVDSARIARALSQIMGRHEVLRTALVAEKELVQQVLGAEAIKLPWQEMDLTSRSPERRIESLEQSLRAWIREPFDLARAPLWRALWVRLDEEDHVLAVNFHHAIVDEWSLRLFFKEVELLYTDGDASLPELPVQYADYSVWQRRQLAGAMLEQQRDYWRAQLHDLPPFLELPADKPRPQRPSGRGAIHHFSLTGPVVAGLRELARQERTTLFTVALAAFQVWLYRYTGQADIIVGTPIANRDRPEVQNLLGYFLNTLPIRARLDGGAGFSTLLRHVRETVLEAFNHATLPFEQIAGLTHQELPAEHRPLYQVMFVLLEEGLPDLRLGQATGEFLAVTTHTSKYDLIFTVHCRGALWNCELEYAADLFSCEQAARMARHLAELLKSIAESPQKPIGHLNLLSAAERGRTMSEGNQTQRPYPREKCLPQLFEEQVERTPQAVAVVFGEESLTYQELNQRANRLAGHLAGLGVGTDTAVGLCVERTPDLAVALLGILKAGGAYVPLDPSLPPQRLAFLIEDSACPVVLTQNSLVPFLTPHLVSAASPPSLVVLADLRLDSRPEPLENPRPPVTPENLAYIMYTSGSTGQPKGVEMPHRALVNLIHWQCSISAMGPDSRTLQFAHPGFDVSFQEMFSTWLSGGTLVLVAAAQRHDPVALLAAIADCRVDRLFLPFVMLEQLAEAAADLVIPSLALKEVSVAGEQLRIGPAIRRFFSRLPGCRLWNHYGPTETHVVTSHELSGPAAGWPELPPIGRPIPNCQIYLLDAGMLPVTPGTAAEMYIGGDCLAHGYRRRADLTAERFLVNPLAEAPRGRLYRTGDLARWRPDGSLDFLGRADQQVKIRGFRVELGEIEAVLARHPAVSAGAVSAQDLGGGIKELTAYLVKREQTIPTAPQLRQWMKEQLPDYMIPSRFLAIPALPLTASGKLDRKALAKTEGVDLVANVSAVAARNEPEKILTDIWQQVLRRKPLSVQDNFFEAGGHSLLAMAICAEVNRRLGVKMPLNLIFDYPTIESLARQLTALDRPADITGTIHQADREQSLPLSFGQHQMWLVQQTLSDPATYNESLAYRLTGPVDEKKIQRALRAIMRRHEVLRTALAQEKEVLRQQVLSPESIKLPWQEMDLTGRTATLDESLRVWTREPFDLARAPLWRALWVKLDEEDHVLAVTFHHAIVDEWSLRLFVEELNLLYATDEAPAQSLPDLPVQYADFALWQRRQWLDATVEKSANFWREQLTGLPGPLELPADKVRPPHSTSTGGIFRFQLAAPLVTGLRDLARRENTTVFTVALAAYQVWLHRYTGQTDIVVGTPIANRERPEVQNLLGYFLNTLPIRTRLDGNGNFTTVLQQVRKTVLAAFRHAAVPFEQMAGLVAPEQRQGPNQLFQAMFVLLEEDVTPLRLDPACSTRMAIDSKTSKCPLTLALSATGPTWSCELEYSSDLFSAERAAAMARHLTELWQSIVAEPDKSISRLNLLPPAERHRLLVEWNQTDREYPRDQCIHHLFEEQARKSPGAKAVTLRNDSLTYRELDRLASHMAGQFRSLGVGPGAIVGVCITRSLDMVVTLLGIVKAGAAYWGVEEKIPEARLLLLLSEARPKLLVVRKHSKNHWTALAEKSPVSSAEACSVAAFEDLAEAPAVARAPATGFQPTMPAYVSFTSGSTGGPKGVVVPHRGVVRLVKGQNYVSLTNEDVLLHLSPLSFDASTFELWGALLNGGRVALMPPGPTSLADIGEAIHRHKITTLWLTAGLFHLMVAERLEDLKPLRQLLAGGDVLSPEHVRKAFRGLSPCRLINGYGPTENTTFTCCHTVVDEADLTPDVPIGRPIANTRVYVLDPSGHPVPVGLAGELYTGGDGLACGYLRQPQLTEERFIPDPFSAEAGARLYRTGDLVRWRPDGSLDFLGRADQQIKIRGFRVELTEIEAALHRHPAVAASTVRARDRGQGDKELVAYIVTRDHAPLTAAPLRQWLAEHLPDYMVPGSFVWLEQLPLTPNGKVDRNALPDPETVRNTADAAPTPPINLLEWELIRIWRGLFKRDDINRESNFFALGGHSLMATRMAAEIDKLFRRNLPISALFQSPTVEALARRLVDEHWAPPWSSLVPLNPQGSKPPLFFVHGVGGDVFSFVELAELLGPDQPCYGIQAVGLDGKAARHATIPEMAAHYVKEIISFQPEGAFYLAGYSLGGLIACEVARQLYRAGRRVAVLALFDTQPVGPVPWLFFGLSKASYLAGRSHFHLHKWRKLPIAQQKNYLRKRWNAFRFWLSQNRFKSAPVMAAPAKDTARSEIPGYLDYYHAAGIGYRLHRYPGPVDLFLSDTGDSNWKWYWRYLARGGAFFHRVPGHHDELLHKKHVPVLSGVLSDVLKRAHQQEQKAP